MIREWMDIHRMASLLILHTREISLSLLSLQRAVKRIENVLFSRRVHLFSMTYLFLGIEQHESMYLSRIKQRGSLFIRFCKKGNKCLSSSDNDLLLYVCIGGVCHVSVDLLFWSVCLQVRMKGR